MKYTVTVKPTENTREWEVVEGFTYGEFEVYEGFIFDGASIPVGLRWMFPHGGRKFGPAALHDLLYRTGVVDKKTADLYFYILMEANNVKPWKAKAMYLGVKYGGFLAWRQRRKQDESSRQD